MRVSCVSFRPTEKKGEKRYRRVGNVRRSGFRDTKTKDTTADGTSWHCVASLWPPVPGARPHWLSYLTLRKVSAPYLKMQKLQTNH